MSRDLRDALQELRKAANDVGTDTGEEPTSAELDKVQKALDNLRDGHWYTR